MNRKIILIICLVFNIGINAQAQSYCDFIKKIREYQNSIKLNEHFELEYRIPEIDTTSFDINVYMSFFDKLSLKAGYKMLLVNIYGMDAGKPALCVQDTTFNMDKFVNETITRHNQNIDSIVDQKKSRCQNENYPENKINILDKFRENQKKSFARNSVLIQYALDSTRRACNNLVPEDTPIGYIQYLFFSQMGEQFALFWHSCYTEKTVICDYADIKYYQSYYSERKNYFEYSEKSFSDLLQLDISPVVVMDSTDCKITWYEIRTHLGIFKCTYLIERKHPFRINNISKDTTLTTFAKFFY